MQNFVRFEKDGMSYYSVEVSGNREIMFLIALFLGTDLRCSQHTWFLDWLDEGQYSICGNATSVDLFADGMIEIRDLLDEEAGPAFRMPKEQYVKMVKEWQELCKKKPKEIIVTWDGKKFSVEGKN